MLMPYLRLVLLFVFSGVFSALCAQVSFQQTQEIISTKGARSGITTAIVDVNADGRDDIVRITSRGILEVYLSSANRKELYKIEYEAALPDIPWSITVGNLDNKGPNEIALGTVYKGGYIFSLNERSERLELIQVTAKDFYSQGANFTDINNDGFIDWFVNDDEDINDIFLNDSTGHVVEADDFIDMRTAQPSDNSGNYSTDWMDIDDDGDMDFYLSKCRSGALSNKDPRRINQLFINDGSNNYEEKASEFGLAFGAQTWASNFGDLDNDGDLDAIIINHIDKWNLLENVRNDTFVERNSSIDSTGGRANQCLLRDFDNNGYLDILVAGANDYLWYNQGNWEFELETKPFPYFSANNFSVGDIDHDGFYDIYAAFSGGFNDPGKVDDALYLNETNDNNWIAFNLVGKESNRSAIGAKIKVYSKNLGVQMRDVRSGESYGMMNSLNQIFGLGDDSLVDSLEVSWPSGQLDVYRDISVRSYYTITEGECISEERSISIENNGYICDGDSITLSAPEGMSYKWSTLDTTQMITVDRWGYYSVKAEESNCAMPIPSVILRPQNDSKYRNLIEQVGQALCTEGEVILEAPEARSYKWSTGAESRTTSVATSGEYTLILEDNCENEFLDTIAIEFIDTSPTTVNDTITYKTGEKIRDARLIANGEKLKWYQSEVDEESIFEGDTLIAVDLVESTTYYVTSETTESFGAESIGESGWIGTSRYSKRTANGGMFFHVREASVIRSLDVMTDSSGVRTVQIFNPAEDLIFEQSYDLVPGDTTIILNADVEPGVDYFITTSADQNLETFGFKGPNLVRNDQQTRFPYQESDLLWITNSSFGEGYYLYFYNWKVKRQDLRCVSNRVPVTAVLNLISSTVEKYDGQFKLYPNPTDGRLLVESMEGQVLKYFTVYDILGREVLYSTASQGQVHEIDLSGLSNGHYYLKLNTTNDLSYAYRVVKIY